MIRKKTTKSTFAVHAILTADWHMRSDQPICRTDDFQEAMWNKVKQVKMLQEKYDCPIYHAGDVFQKWNSSPLLINKCSYYFPEQFHSIIGNHDMPSHNIEFMEQSAYQTLMINSTIHHLHKQTQWKYEPQLPFKFTARNIAIVHMMVWKGDIPWPGCTDPEADEVFGMFPDADLILTGHNHKTFTARNDNQLLVNPGSLTRHKADQEEHRPCVFLYDAFQNKVKQHFLKVRKDVISRVHIDIKKEKEAREIAYISKLQEGWDVSLSFEDNLERAYQDNQTPEEIKDLIREWREDVRT